MIKSHALSSSNISAYFFALLFTIFFFSGCGGIGLSTVENDAIIRAQSIYDFENDLSYNVFNAADNPCVILFNEGLSIYSIDGKKIIEKVIPDKRLAFVAPGIRTLRINYPSSINIKYVDSRGNTIRYATKGISAITLPEKIVFESGKHYTMSFIDGNIISKEITDSATLSEINSYLLEYRRKKAEYDKIAQKFISMKEHFLNYAKNNPNIFEGKWVSDAFANHQVLEFKGDTIKHSKNAGGILGVVYEGKFIYDENIILPNYQVVTGVAGTRGSMEDEPEQGNQFLAPIYYYILNGDTLEIKQRSTLANFGMYHGGIYTRVR
ncbi:MAG: hypothetical protein LBD17_03985 [Endomicrobium sp.]|jgi:hypothetical protein|nr:hypothetical protein [Endomicrobium sp.]